MKAVGIAAEYNPIHNGHILHIQKTREALGECAVVCVMSGCFVQRGEPAAYHKFARAEAAVRSGADLVIENPVPWALSSAEGFARGAVGILGSLGVVSCISFGCENADISALDLAARALMAPEFAPLLAHELEEGDSFAAARERALRRLVGDGARVIRTPNNILAVEYIRALYEQRLEIQPLAIAREGSAHDSADGGSLPSASELRTRLSHGMDITEYIPEGAAEVYEREERLGRGALMPESLETAVLSRLRMLPDSAFESLPDAGEGLHNRLRRAARSAASMDALLAEAKTKRYAMSRIRRMAMCAAIGVKAGDSAGTPPYIRILAANAVGRALLREAEGRSLVPVVTKSAALRREDEHIRRVFELECAATDLYSLGFKAVAERRGGLELITSPAMV